jgi:type I restriction enzyme, S subunit
MQYVKLGEVCERLKAGGTPLRSEPSYWSGPIPFVKIEDLTESRGSIWCTRETITESGLVSSSAWMVPVDSVLIAMYASIGETAINRIPVATNQAIIAAVPDRSKILPDYLYFVVAHGGRELASHSIQTTQKNITKGIVESWRIALPSLTEQEHVVGTLRSVETALIARRRELDLERERKAALMDHLFTNGTHGESTKQTEIGEMPESWEVVQLGRLIVDGPQNGLYKHQSEYGSGTPIVRIDDFDNDGAFVAIDFERVRLDPDETTRYRLLPDDLLINRVNSLTHLGKSALVPELAEATVYESNMMRLRVDEAVLRPAFLRRFLTLPQTRDRMRRMAKLAVAQASINQGDVKSLLVPLPPHEQQSDIEQVIDRQDAVIRALLREMAGLESLFRSMLDGFMSGALQP